MKAVNIQWDTDGKMVDLPNEIDLPDGMTDEDEISDYITEQTGFCHFGFSLDTDDKGDLKTNEIKFFEICMSYEPDGTNNDCWICIKGVRQPTVEEANEFLKEDCKEYGEGRKVISVDPLTENEAKAFYDLSNVENWLVFGRD